MLQKMSACSDNSSNTWRAPKLACSRDIKLNMARLGVEAPGSVDVGDDVGVASAACVDQAIPWDPFAAMAGGKPPRPPVVLHGAILVPTKTMFMPTVAQATRD
jgi:hypothetical protein